MKYSAILITFIIAATSVLAATNPASLYCTNQGYTLSGENCIFPDGSSCEQWAFYNGECDYNACIEENEVILTGQSCCAGLSAYAAPGKTLEKCVTQTTIDSYCIAEGNTIAVMFNPPVCCAGLDLIPSPNPYNIGVTGVCTALCGDGICNAETESETNCEADCLQCVQEGESLGPTWPPSEKECCEGLVAVIPPDVWGTRGTCEIPEPIVGVPAPEECKGEGESLGAVVPGNTAQCCSGLEAVIPANVVGTRGTCEIPEPIVGVPAPDEETIPSQETGVPAPTSCKKEGEGIPVIPNPPSCCSGLTLIPPKDTHIMGISGICTAKCGNNICDLSESDINCPKDCGCAKKDEVIPSTSTKECCSGLEPILPQGVSGMKGICREISPEKQVSAIYEEPCKREGETIPVIQNPPQCCEGYELIKPQDEQILGISGICTKKCGNYICDKSESPFNCPKDCKEQMLGDSKDQQNDIIGQDGMYKQPELIIGREGMFQEDERILIVGGKATVNVQNIPVDVIVPEKAIINIQKNVGFTKVENFEMKIENNKPVYVVNTVKETKLFNFLPLKMKIEVDIDAQSGEVTAEKKPWWSFIAG